MRIKDRKTAAKEIFRLPAGRLEPINLSERPFIPPGMTRAFRNNRFTVMVYDNEMTTRGSAITALIQRHDGMPIPEHWREIQSIKNEIFGSEAWAVEYYPAESNLIDQHNIYWIWIYPEGILPEPLRGKKY